jgi:transcriptional regulator with XRE-family HTH domain
MVSVIGERLRALRQSQGRSLADVAEKAKISVATLSRIENDKQSVDLGLFITLAAILHVAPRELLAGDDDDDGSVDPIVRRIASLDARGRAQLWHELAAKRRNARPMSRGAALRDLAHQVEELLAHVEFLRQELEIVRKRISGASTRDDGDQRLRRSAGRRTTRGKAPAL